MRRVNRVAATGVAVVALLVAGCSPGEPPGSSEPAGSPAGGRPAGAPTPRGTPAQTVEVDHAADVAALATVSLTGNLGTMPFFNLTPPFTLTSDVARVADKGTGKAVAPGHAVAVHVAQFNPKTETIEASSYDQGPELLLADQASLPQALYEVMVGAQVGSRILFGSPANGITTIYSFEILATAAVFEQAEGTAVTPPAGLPTITRTGGGEPALKAVGGNPPDSLVVQPLIRGSGDRVSADSWLVVNYRNWLWDGTEVVSTWADGHPIVMRMADSIQGWQEGLAGQTIGSQVMLVVPPDKAFGASATERVPAGSTLIFVIDILGGM